MSMSMSMSIGMTRIGLGLLLGIGLGTGALGCATSASVRTDAGACRSRAQNEYSQCVNPLYFPPGEPHETVHSRDAQACRDAYLQALDVCAQLSPETEDDLRRLTPSGTQTSSTTAKTPVPAGEN